MTLLRTTAQLLLFVLIEIYFYYGIKEYLKKNTFKNIYFILSALGALVIMGAAYKPFILWPRWMGVYVVGTCFVILFSKLIGSVFLLVGDVVRGIKLIIQKTSNTKKKQVDKKISRAQFFNQLAFYGTAIPLLSFVYGMIVTAFDYKIHRVKLSFPNFPKAFNGLKIVQISDIHTGTYINQGPLERAIQLVMKESADIIFFTGDLVNEIADEAFPYKTQLASLKAPIGVYSILGNHDYGDYFRWENDEDKKKNLVVLKQFEIDCGWDLLLNEHRVLERNEDQLAIVGVENWGNAMRFPKLGDIAKAKKGTEQIPFKILLSHDPSHWDAKVLGQHPDIDLMLSGHTHGMQLGVEIKGFKWSPSRFFYKQWAGLYQTKHQYLYVNRGLGIIGYPGRVGIRPEITVIELFSE
ncbi:MAG: metallophosphoesterase [Bacteroidia bacterium]|nr:metallophosphoesterase [Bacteroidia bacterium]